MTMTLGRATWHTVVHHSSTSTYTTNFIRIGETFCGWTDVCMDGQTDIKAGFIRSTRRSQLKIRAEYSGQPDKRRKHVLNTYTATAHEDDNESFEPTSDTNHPHQTNKQNDSKDVLNARKVDAKNCTKLARLSRQQYA